MKPCGRRGKGMHWIMKLERTLKVECWGQSFLPLAAWVLAAMSLQYPPNSGKDSNYPGWCSVLGPIAVSRDVRNYDSPRLYHVPTPGARSVITNGREVWQRYGRWDREILLSPRNEKNCMLNDIKARMPVLCFFFKNLFYFLKCFIYLFLERGEGREKEGERSINVWLPLAQPPLGTWPVTQACAPTGNQTDIPSVHRPAFNPLSHTSQGSFFRLKIKRKNKRLNDISTIQKKKKNESFWRSH